MILKRIKDKWDKWSRQDWNDNMTIIEKNFNNVVDVVSNRAYNQVVESATLIWKEPVNTFSDLVTTYPDAEVGWTVTVREVVTGFDGKGVNKVYRYNGTEWTEIQQILADAINAVDHRLSSQLAQINVNVRDFGAIGNGIVDDTQAFQLAANNANSSNVPLLIPEGQYYIGGTVDCDCEVVCHGTILLSHGDSGYAFRFRQDEHVYTGAILTSIFAGAVISEGQSKAPWISNLPIEINVGDTITIETSEVLINRNNSGVTQIYTKNDSFTAADVNYSITPIYAHTINDVSKITKLIVRKARPKANLQGLTFDFIDSSATDNQRSVMYVSRDYINITNLKVNNVLDEQIKIAISIEGNHVYMDKISINGCNYVGLGYGLVLGNCHDIVIDNSVLLDCRHAITGRHSKMVNVKNSELADFDNHYGFDAYLYNCTLQRHITYAGYKITIEKCRLVGSVYRLLSVREDTPELYGEVMIEDCTVSSYNNTITNYIELFYVTATAGFDYGRTLRSPRLKMKNVSVFADSAVNTLYLINCGSSQYSPLNGRTAFDSDIRDIYTTISKTVINHPVSTNANAQNDALSINNVNQKIEVKLDKKSADTSDLNRGVKLNIKNCNFGVDLIVNAIAIATNSSIGNSKITAIARLQLDTAAEQYRTKLEIRNCVFENAIITSLFKLTLFDNILIGTLVSEGNATSAVGYNGLQSRLAATLNNKSVSNDVNIKLVTQNYSDGSVIAQHSYFNLLNNYREGSGAPNGVITAPVTAFYADTDNGKLYYKQTGTGNTGWKEVTLV